MSNGFALACGALGGFSGFLSEKFRSHDYLLGRRNCQEFLRSHFRVPATTSPLFSVVNPSLKSPGSPGLAPGSGPPSLPIIPLVGELATPERLPDWPKGAFQPDSLRAPATARLKQNLRPRASKLGASQLFLSRASEIRVCLSEKHGR